MKKEHLIGIEIYLLFLGLIGVWFIDIGTSALVLEAQGYKAYVVGFIAKDPNTHYHLGLLFVSFSIVCQSYLAIIFTRWKDEPMDFPNKKG